MASVEGARVSGVLMVTEGSPRAALTLTVTNAAHDPEIMATAELTVSADLSTAGKPASVGAQIVGWTISLDGTEIPARWVESVSVTRGRFQSSTWTLQMRLDDDETATSLGLADLLADACGPFGHKLVNITLRLQAPGTSLVDFPLIVGGVAHDQSTSYSFDGRTLTVSGLGPEARSDAKKIDKTLPAGTNRLRGRVAQEIMSEAGITDPVAIADGSRLNKRLQVTDALVLPLVDQLLEPDLVRIHMDRLGTWVAAPMGAISGTSGWHFTAADLEGETGLSPAQSLDVPARLVVETTAQITEGSADGCSLKTMVSTVEIFSSYAPKRAAFSQGIDGTLTAAGTTGTATNILTERITSRRTYRCGTLVLEITERERYHKGPEHFRYRLETDGDISALNYATSVYVYPTDAVKDDENAAYLWSEERFVLVERTTVRHEFDADGYGHKTTTRVDGYDVITIALKSRTNANVEWDTLAWQANQKVLGGGEAVRDAQLEDQGGFYEAGSVAFPRGVKETVTEREIDGGFIVSETSATSEYALKEGQLHLFGNETVYGEDEKTWQVTETVNTAYLVGAEEETAVVTQSATNDLTGETVTTIDDTGQYLPAASRLQDVVPTASSYGADEDPDEALAAALGDTQTVIVDREIEADCTQDAERRIIVEFAEDEGDLDARFEHEKAQFLSKTVTFAVPAAPLDELTALALTFPPAGLSATVVHLESVTTSDSGPGTPVLTLCTGRIYP